MHTPTYTVRYSKKAKRIILRIDPVKGLEIVGPPGFDTCRIPNILHEKRDWIKRHLESITRANQRLESARNIPNSLQLKATGEHVHIRIQNQQTRKYHFFDPHSNVLYLYPDHNSYSHIAALIRHWLKKRAKSILPGWLEEIAHRHSLDYNQVSIGFQKTRWASCSSKKTISLNSKLLFLPPVLVEHVFVHELCHTCHPNHSRDFWELLCRLQPEYRSLEQELRKSWQQVVPAFLEIY